MSGKDNNDPNYLYVRFMHAINVGIQDIITAIVNSSKDNTSEVNNDSDNGQSPQI